MKPILLSVLILLTFTLPLHGRERTTRTGLRPSAAVNATTVKHETQTPDTLSMPDESILKLSGYDKPLRSRRESMFASNLSDSLITSITVEIEYLDMQNRQLHEEIRTINCYIPPHQTRCIYMPSWDRQQSFYYRLSSKPARADGTPFSVKCRIIQCTVIDSIHLKHHVTSR